MRSAKEIEIESTRLHLLPEKAIYWPAEQLLLIADLHMGKAEAFRAAALPLPNDNTKDLTLLGQLLRSTQARRFIILGDFWHSRSGRTAQQDQQLIDWRNQFPDIAMEIVLGNHDLGAGELPNDLNMQCHQDDITIGPFRLSHYPQENPTHYTLAGHLHPAYVLRGKGYQKIRMPCFWLTPHVCVLPAFGRFTGMAEITPQPHDRIYGIVEDEVIPIPF